jgi:hypothetical protein
MNAAAESLHQVARHARLLGDALDELALLLYRAERAPLDTPTQDAAAALMLKLEGHLRVLTHDLELIAHEVATEVTDDWSRPDTRPPF